MSPVFNPAERDRISRQLAGTARRLFTTQGLRKTSLDDLVHPAGIAKSSFYSFYDSKESLYLALMFDQVTDLETRLSAAVRKGRGARSRLRLLLREIVDVLHTDPLYRRLLTHPEELRAVRERLGPQHLAQVEEHLVRPFADLIADGQRAGQIVPADPAVVFGALRAVLLLPVHAAEFGDQYQAVLDLLIDSVTRGLTSTRRPATERSDP